MSRVMKCICDGCGREIDGGPIQIYAERTDLVGFLADSEDNPFWEPGRDYCDSCMKQIINFVDGLPARNAGKPAVKNPEFEKALPHPKEENGSMKNQKKSHPTIKELLREGKSVEDIVQITGCTRSSVTQTKYQMKKAQMKKAQAQESNPVVPVQTVICDEVMKTCEYAGKTGGLPTCDYALIVGHSRGCPPEACTAYKKRGKSGRK